MAADQTLEWEVVTGTGEFLTANRANNSDLYCKDFSDPCFFSSPNGIPQSGSSYLRVNKLSGCLERTAAKWTIL